MISTEWPASSLSAIFYWIFCLPVLIFGLVFQVSINTLTLTLYYRFLITNSHFKTFFDCKAQITVSGTLNPLKTLLQISWLFHNWTCSLLWRKQRKRLTSSRQKLIINYYVVTWFFLPSMSTTQETFKFFLSVCVFSLCIFNLTMRNYGII